MNLFQKRNHEFWNNLAETKTREELLELIKIQNPDLIMQINRIEWVFKNKLTHLSWPDGADITERPLSGYELALLIDPIFEPIDELLDLDIPATQQKELHTASDTVMWARDICDFKPRVYQILMLRHPKKFKVLRAGRRLGKALDIDTPIPTPNGWTTMKELEVGDQVFDEQGKPCNVTFTTDVQWDRSCYRVSFSDGSHLIADADHQWTVDTKQSRKARGRAKNPMSGPVTLTTKDMLDNLYIETGGKLEVNYSIENTKPVEYQTKELPINPWLFGLWLADGKSCDGTITIGIEDQKEILAKIESLGYKYYSTSDPIQFRIEGLYKGLNELEVLRKYKSKNYNKCGGYYPGNNITKHIPNTYLQASPSQREDLLKGLMDGDGTVYKNSNCEFCVCNEQLAIDTYELITSLGYRATFSEGESKFEGRVVGTRYRINFTPWQPVFSLSRKLERQNLREMPSSRQRCRYIVGIEKVDSVPVKCITVDSPNSLYLAGKNYIPTHNTATMAIKLMHYSYVNKGGKSIVIAPMLAQATLIYKEIMKWSKESDKMMEAIERKKASPPAEINFTNDSSIIFFTSGMKTGSKADATRGQEAHLIILDEVDYMGDDDLDAILAMMQKTDENQPDKELIGASTPTGRRAVFYDWCTDPHSGFKEFWFPSYVNPYFDKETEDALRGQYTELGWKHEIEADWGEDAQGVYPRKYVDSAFNARDPWDYELFPDLEGWDPDSFFVMGVDWDKYGAGTNIVVLQVFGKNPRDSQLKNKVIMYYREEVPRDEYTFTKATNRIIELNQILHPKHIYIDRGAGEVQAEMLHLYGKENPHSGLHKKVKGVQFGENIDVREPYTQEMTKKPIKPYMVDNLRLFLERKQIMFPAHDDELHLQLISYIVIRENESGRPVFEMSTGKIGDHAHDALILACYAITDNYGDLHNVKINFQGVSLSSNLVPDSKDVDTIAEDKDEGKEGIFSISRSFSASKKRRHASKRISRSMF